MPTNLLTLPPEVMIIIAHEMRCTGSWLQSQLNLGRMSRVHSSLTGVFQQELFWKIMLYPNRTATLREDMESSAQLTELAKVTRLLSVSGSDRGAEQTPVMEALRLYFPNATKFWAALPISIDAVRA